TDMGKKVRRRQHFTASRKITRKAVAEALGTPLSSPEIRSSLASYGYGVSGTGESLSITLPSYRNDLMHPVDIIEDVAISRGYGSFAAILPSAFTVDTLSRIEQLSDKVRELMVGFGFQEIVSNILGSREDLLKKMCLTSQEQERRVLEIDNVMSQSVEMVRQ